MKPETNERTLHPLGETSLDFKFLPAGGQFHLRGSDESLTPYGGLVAWDHFLEHCGVIAELAAGYPLPRTSPNATPVADILKAFSPNCPIGGTSFAHCRRLQDDEAVARFTGMRKAMEKVWRSPLAQHRIRPSRGDIGFGQQAIMAWHEQGKGKRPSYLFKPRLNGWSCGRRVVVERTLRPLNESPQGGFWKQCREDFSAYVTNLPPEEAAALQIVQLYRQRAGAENVFDELKNQWGFSGFRSQKAAVSQSSARMPLLGCNLWSLFVRVLKNQGGHTEAIKSRYGLLLIPAELVLSGRRKIVKLAVGGKFAGFLRQAYQRLERWPSQTAPQLNLTMGKSPPWLLFDPTQANSTAVT